MSSAVLCLGSEGVFQVERVCFLARYICRMMEPLAFYEMELIS